MGYSVSHIIRTSKLHWLTGLPALSPYFLHSITFTTSIQTGLVLLILNSDTPSLALSTCLSSSSTVSLTFGRLLLRCLGTIGIRDVTETNGRDQIHPYNVTKINLAVNDSAHGQRKRPPQPFPVTHPPTYHLAHAWYLTPQSVPVTHPSAYHLARAWYLTPQSVPVTHPRPII